MNFVLIKVWMKKMKCSKEKALTNPRSPNLWASSATWSSIWNFNVNRLMPSRPSNNCFERAFASKNFCEGSLSTLLEQYRDEVQCKRLLRISKYSVCTVVSQGFPECLVALSIKTETNGNKTSIAPKPYPFNIVFRPRSVENPLRCDEGSVEEELVWRPET